MPEPEFRSAPERMPYEPSVSCAACSAGVDPLRAPAVIMLDRGLRYFCSTECQEGYRSADASRPLSVRPMMLDSALGDWGEELVQILVHEPTPERQPPPVLRSLSVWPLMLAAVAVGVGFVPGPATGLASAVLLGVCASWVTLSSSVQQSEVGIIAWLAAPLGVAMLAVAGLLSPSREPLLAAAALGVLTIWAREYMARRTQEPIDQLIGSFAVACHSLRAWPSARSWRTIPWLARPL